MNIVVLGLWHLGSVTAACAARHFEVIGLDFDPETVRNLRLGESRLAEPGLDALLKEGLDSRRLRFSGEASVCRHAEVLWVTHDTPMDDEDRPQVERVLDDIRYCAPHLAADSLVLLSAQLPVGTCRRLETELSGLGLRFACSPENLCLGDALAVFQNPDRVVIGCRDARTRGQLQDLFRPFSDRIIWMRPESAEMTKHAINSFLALSITYINEVARLCEVTGADAKEVEAGLKSERRIGPKAYLSPSGPFSGGTLARDVAGFIDLAMLNEVPLEVIPAIKRSNDRHRLWTLDQIERIFAGQSERRIALFGLTYKAGTNTLRRSGAVELARSLAQSGFYVRACDPSQISLPLELDFIDFHASPVAASANVDAIVLCTPWPEFLGLEWPTLLKGMRRRLVIDVGRHLERHLASLETVHYLTIGSAPR